MQQDKNTIIFLRRLEFDPLPQLMYFPVDYNFKKFSGYFLSLAPATQLLGGGEYVTVSDYSNTCHERRQELNPR